jgi:hypothetical protein
MGTLLVLGALVGLAVTPATEMGSRSYDLSPNVTIVTTVSSVNSADITWLTVMAAVGIATLIASLVLPRRGTRAPQRGG